MIQHRLIGCSEPHDGPATCPNCKTNPCVCCHKPDANSGKGHGASRKADDMDVVDRINMAIGYRLAHGFRLMSENCHEL